MDCSYPEYLLTGAYSLETDGENVGKPSLSLEIC